MKRTLALVLALVMVLGMMAVPASADFTDSKEIKYVEAVEVVAAAGIIDGFEDGSFDPAGTLTREQAAKLVAYMMLGQKNADALKATSAPFEDVAASRWSAGYIAYCVNEGIIAGRDEKTFDPTGKVTAFEFAKLMLGALGYDSSIEQFTGNVWSINVGKIALTADIFDGNEGADYNAPATREEAALYVFNTLKADLVEYDEKGTNIDLGNGITINTGASKAEPASVRASDKASNIVNEAKDQKADVVQFAERYFKDLERTAGTADAFGRPADKWTYDGEKVGTYAKEADFTYTTATKGKTIYADLDKPSKATYKFVVDGKTVENAGDVKADFAIASGNEVKAGGNGTLIEVYDMDNDNYKVVIINTYVGEIETYIDADDNKVDEDKAAVEVNPLYKDTANKNVGAAAASLNKDGYFKTSAFSAADEDDGTVVLFTAAYNDTDKAYDVKSVVAADSTTAFVTKSNGEDGFTAGESYKYSANWAKLAEYVKDADDSVIYTDSYGYAIYIDGVEATKNFAYVVEVADDGLFASSTTYYAKVVLDDGTEKTVEIKKASYTAFNEKVGENDKGAIVTYTVDSDDVYKFVSIAPVGSSEINIDKGVSKFTAGKLTVYANSGTIFVVADPDAKDPTDVDYTVYTGIKNVPSMTAGKVAAFDKDGNAVKAGSVAKFVFVYDATADSSTVEDIVFVQAASISNLIKDEDFEDGYYTVNAVVNGEVTSLKLDVATGEALKADVIAKGYTVDKDGLVDGWKAFTEKDTDYKTTTTENVVKVTESSGNIKLELADSNEYVTYDKDTNVFTVDNGDETITAEKIDTLSEKNVTVTIVTYKDVAAAVYVYVG